MELIDALAADRDGSRRHRHIGARAFLRGGGRRGDGVRLRLRRTGEQRGRQRKSDAGPAWNMFHSADISRDVDDGAPRADPDRLQPRRER